MTEHANDVAFAVVLHEIVTAGLVVVVQLLQNAPDEVLVMASSTLCNLLLEFSPSKEVRSTIFKKYIYILRLQY